MPIDPSIPLSVRPPAFNNPFEQLAQIRANQQEQQLRQQQQQIQQQRINQGQQQQAEAERQQAVKKAAQDAIAQIKGGNAEAVFTQLAPEVRAVAEEWYQGFQDNRRQREDLAMKDRKSRAQLVQKFGYDPTVAEVMFGLDDDPQAMEMFQQLGGDEAALRKVVDGFATYGETPKTPEDFTLGPGQQRFGPDGQAIASVPVTPPDAPKTIDEALLVASRAKDGVEVRRLLNLKGQSNAAGRAPAAPNDEPLESVIGPDGKPVLVRRSDAVGKTRSSGASKPATGLEKRALNFFNRARQADVDLEGLEPQIAKMNLGQQTYMQWAPNFAQTETGQLYTQAQRAFTEARLRKDSGAAIPEQEFTNDRRTYFAQPGDSPNTLEQKRRARAAVLASLGFESGQALGEFVGDPDEARSVVEGYKTRSAATTSKKKIGRFEVVVD